eukprot:TRINITY_DN14703_c0_g1_i1.p1 TRINITY_DN14703_c0_g1~~TRINITY_DN14703_c0_g1_i1.p1  ORF type:complete len:327 (+),score=61.76 TRINITY_DN14703_c0_g1_i1:72-983(+)
MPQPAAAAARGRRPPPQPLAAPDAPGMFMSPAEYARFGRAPPAPREWVDARAAADEGDKQPPAAPAQRAPRSAGGAPAAGPGLSAQRVAPLGGPQRGSPRREPAPHRRASQGAAARDATAGAPAAAQQREAPAPRGAPSPQRQRSQHDRPHPFRSSQNFNDVRHLVRIGGVQSAWVSQWTDGLRQPAACAEPRREVWKAVLRRDVGWRPAVGGDAPQHRGSGCHAARGHQWGAEQRRHPHVDGGAAPRSAPPPQRSSSAPPPPRAGGGAAPREGGETAFRRRLAEAHARLQSSLDSSLSVCAP